MTSDDGARDQITRWGENGNVDRLLELSAILRALQEIRRTVTPPHIPFDQLADLSSKLVEVSAQITSAGASGDARLDAAVASAARHARNVGLSLHRASDVSEESAGLVRYAIAEREKSSDQFGLAVDRMKAVGFPLPEKH